MLLLLDMSPADADGSGGHKSQHNSSRSHEQSDMIEGQIIFASGSSADSGTYVRIPRKRRRVFRGFQRAVTKTCK